ncbi:MAG: hypothetical protein ABJG15_09045 [Hyphomonadaceae bacterium]
MEFKYGLWAGISSIKGMDGRQLGEDNTRPLIFNEHIPAETLACKYKGSRYGKLINISSLRTVMGQFYDATAIAVAVRDYHMVQTNRAITDVPGIWDLYVISRASLALIAYRYRADGWTADDELPDDIGSQYKLITGVFMICQVMLAQAHPAIKQNSPISSHDLFTYADENFVFRSTSGMMCAGSEAKIHEFLEFANQGRNHPQSANLSLEAPDDHIKLLGNYVSDVEAWYRYALLTIELDYFIELEVLRRKMEALPEDAENLQSVRDIYLAQNAYWLDLLGGSEATSPTSFKQGILDRQNTILALLKKPAVSGISDRAIRSRIGG